MRRRERWMMLALVLLPSILGIGALSVIRLSGRSAEPAVLPAPASPAIEARPALEAIPPGPAAPASAPEPRPSAPETSPTKITPEPGAQEAEDPEERPLIPVTMLADNRPAPSVEFDSLADSSFATASERRSTLGFGSSIGGGSGGGASDSGSAGSSKTGEEPSGDVPGDAANPSSTLVGGSAQSEPTLPQPNGSESDDGDQRTDRQPEPPAPEAPKEDEIGGGETPPADPLTTLTPDLIKPIEDGRGFPDGEEPIPHVTVPEPSTWGLFGIALLGATLARRKPRAG